VSNRWPEHSVEELVENTLFAQEINPVFSGSARRISIPNTELEMFGMVSEARMALILAVVRLAMGPKVPGNCTHEPSGIGAMAGANLFWAENGSNPGCSRENGNSRGLSVAQCRKIFSEAGWVYYKGLPGCSSVN
jgi:biotin synthase